MKSILISIKPKYVAKILSGEKTLEVRTTAPKCALPIDVYIYCTKTIKPSSDYDWGEFTFDDLPKLGKVVAKFTLRKVKEFINGLSPLEREYCVVDNEFDYQAYEDVLEKACLTYEEAEEYAPDQSFYAWYISDLVVFDKPKKLEEFYSTRLDEDITKLFDNSIQLSDGKWVKRLDKSPRSWCYVEEN